MTNDQGRYLVDSAFVRAEGVPAVEVTGGCFCCNYDDFARMVVALGRRVRPDVIFAESVGSCADLVATVVKPLLAAPQAEGRLRSLSVFSDIRLLDRWLEGRSLPFSESVTYIFGKQLEEAGVIIVNKADLLAEAQAQSVAARAARRFPGKEVRLQSSLRDDDVSAWLRLMDDAGPGLLPSASLDIDYDRYGAGESELAWLDARVTLHCSSGAGEAVQAVLEAVASTLRARRAAIGHIKALVECGGSSVKLSLTGADGEVPRVPRLAGQRVSLGLNARAQMPAADLREVVHAALADAAADLGFLYELEEEAAFHPGEPRPTHRMA